MMPPNSHEEFESQLKALRGVSFRAFGAEQLAGMTIRLMQLVEAGEVKPFGDPHSQAMILGDWIAPTWLGEPALNGIYSSGGIVKVVPDYEAPSELRELFVETIALLYRHHLIRRMPGQYSDDLIELTGEGQTVLVFEDFGLDIPRGAKETIARLAPSVFRIVTVSELGDETGGTAFLVSNQRLATCAHCIQKDRFKLLLNDMETDERHFSVTKHEERDLAVLTPKSVELRRLLAARRWFRLEDRADSLVGGEPVVSFGYPYLPRLNPQLIPESGAFKAYTTAYEGCDFLTLTNSGTGGCSGGPVVNAREQLVGVMTEMASEETDTSGRAKPLTTTGLATPAKYLAELLGTRPPDGPLPFKVCPKCGSTDLVWGEDYEYDIDDDGEAYRTRLDVAFCSKCNWQSEPVF